jgi:hypothetical protein
MARVLTFNTRCRTRNLITGTKIIILIDFFPGIFRALRTAGRCRLIGSVSVGYRQYRVKVLFYFPSVSGATDRRRSCWGWGTGIRSKFHHFSLRVGSRVSVCGRFFHCFLRLLTSGERVECFFFFIFIFFFFFIHYDVLFKL